MKRVAWLLAPLLLLGCAAEETEPVQTPVTTVTSTTLPDPFAGLEAAVRKTEENTGTEVGVALYDGSEMTQAGSLQWLPAWSTIKIPIARAAAEHCEYDEDSIAELTEAAIEWSDNDAARALWECMGSDDEASAKVGEEIAKSGSQVRVAGAFGTTRWPFAGQARYAFYLSQQDQDNPVIADMHHIAKDQSYGLGQLNSVPFKGGWSDDETDGSWHTRQLGWLNGFGVSIGARSAEGSYDDTMEALDQVAELVQARASKAKGAAHTRA